MGRNLSHCGLAVRGRWRQREDLHRDVAKDVEAADEGQAPPPERVLDNRSELIFTSSHEDESTLSQPLVLAKGREVALLNGHGVTEDDDQRVGAGEVHVRFGGSAS
jgi:hypothetical protein